MPCAGDFCTPPRPHTLQPSQAQTLLDRGEMTCLAPATFAHPHAHTAEMDQLRQGELFKLKQQVEEAQANGRDLLKESPRPREN